MHRLFILRRSWSMALAGVASVGVAPHRDASAQTGPAPHPLGAVVARTRTPVDYGQVVALSDGRVLIADPGRRILSLFDSTLSNPKVVLDSTTGLPNTYDSGMGSGLSRALGFGGVSAGGRGSAGGGMEMLPLWPQSFLIPFRGDSTLWYDRVAGVFLVIHPDGSLGRPVQSPPAWRPTPGGSYSSFFSSRFAGTASSSPTLGVVYKANVPSTTRSEQSTPGNVYQRVTTAPDSVVFREDSLPLLRMDFATRKIDTLAKLSTGSGTRHTFEQSSRSSSSFRSPYPFIDDAIATSDGAIAIYRARQYRIEWLTPEGKRVLGARLPYEWRMLNTAQTRQAFIDSIDAVKRAVYDSLLRKRAADSARDGGVPMRTSTSSSNGIVRTQQVPVPPPTPPLPTDPDLIPEYLPPTNGTPLLADADGHVWIRPTPRAPDPGFVVYDVVDRVNGLVERVRVPINRYIVGFGRGGFVFLLARDGGVATIEKVRIR